MTNVIQHPSSGAIRTFLGHSVRTGEASYRSLERLYAENRLPVSSVIVDASKVRHQREFINTLIEDKVEVVLDTKCAELSALGRFGGYARGAPWHVADSVRPLSAVDFRPGSSKSVFGPIADYAIEIGAHAIHSPSHFLSAGVLDPWFDIDIASLLALRSRLDQEGRYDVSIDYLLMMPSKLIQDEIHQKYLLQRLSGLPFDNLVIRLSGFGSDATAAKMKRVFIALRRLHALDKPIVLDHVGGLVAQSALAFNVVSGIANGVGERARFDATTWNKKPPTKSESNFRGRALFIPIPGLDRSFKKSELELMLATRGSRRKLACHDRECCGPQGLAYLRGEHKAHISRQMAGSINAISHVPNRHRAGHFMNNEIRLAERRARELEGLVTDNESINTRLSAARKRIDSFSRTLETMIDEPQQSALPPSISVRGNYLRRPA